MDQSLPSTSSENFDKNTMEKELTNKFLSGEMSFVDYSNKWYDNDDEDDIETSRLNENDNIQTLQQLSKNQKRRKYTRLSAVLLGLMGEANLRFVRGERDIAEKMCYEIIKQVPTAPEPYQTLAQLYEHDAEKSLHFSLLAAHLSPSDAQEWLRLASISKQRNDLKQEMICYTQAIKAEPHNLTLHLKRVDLHTALEDTNYPVNLFHIPRVKCYHKIVNSMPPSEGEAIMKYTKMAVTLYQGNNEIERSLEVMATAYKKCSHLFKMEDINIFMELLIASKQYQTCIEIFVANAGVEIEAEIQTVQNSDNAIEEQTNYIKCTIPDNLPIDLKSKLLVCFIHLGSISLVQTLLEDFLNNDVEKAGDLHMDVEEAFSSVGEHELALRLLEPLITNSKFDMGAVWLKHAECLNKLNKEQDSINSYYKVLKHAPQHAGARQKLFSLLKNKGCIDEALKVLEQDKNHLISPSLLYEQCCILKKYNKTLKYLEVGEALLSRTFMRYRHQEELALACRAKGGVELIHNFRTVRGEKLYNDDDIYFNEDDPFKLTQEQEWDLFQELLTIALENKQYYKLQRLSFGALNSKNLTPHRPEIEFYCLQSCLLNNDYLNAFKFIKDITQKDPTPCSWNLLSFITNSTEENAHIKYLTRMFSKENHAVKNLFLGNNFLTSGRYIVALKYFLEYHEQWREPLSALLIGITILVMAAQRTVDKHHILILQGMSYLFQYKDLRQCDQESYYNIGRAYQMLNINNLAIEFYERALACPPVAVCKQHGVLDLTRETAYNLYILYKEHSPQIAKKYMMDFLVV